MGGDQAGIGSRRCGFASALAGLALLVGQPASAGWVEDFGALRIGLISPAGGRAVPGLSQITTAYERALGVPVKVLVARDYPALIRAQAEGRVHYAIHSALGFAATEHLCGCVEALAAPRGVDGATGLRAVVIARRAVAEGIASAAGARVIAGPLDAPGPQSLALAALAGVSGAEPASVVHAASQSAAETAFLAGKAEFLVGWEPHHPEGRDVVFSGTLARLRAAATETFETIWSSAPLTYGPHAVRIDLPAELRERLGRFLLHVNDQQPDVYQLLEPLRGGGFVMVGNGDYAAARQLAAAYAAPETER